MTIFYLFISSYYFFLAACSREPEAGMEAFQNQSSVVIVLEELGTNEIPEQIGELTEAEELTQLQRLEYLDLSLNKRGTTGRTSQIQGIKEFKHLRVLGNHFDEAEMLQFKEEFPKLKLEYKNEDVSQQ